MEYFWVIFLKYSICSCLHHIGESMVYSFISSFAGIVTRRPLVLQLHKTDEGQQEYAEFGHLPRRRFTDFSMWNDIRYFIFLRPYFQLLPPPPPKRKEEKFIACFLVLFFCFNFKIGEWWSKQVKSIYRTNYQWWWCWDMLSVNVALLYQKVSMWHYMINDSAPQILLYSSFSRIMCLYVYVKCS